MPPHQHGATKTEGDNQMSIISDIFGFRFDSFARLLRLDEYPNQQEIVDWPMTEQERIELQTIEALADFNIEYPNGYDGLGLKPH